MAARDDVDRWEDVTLLTVTTDDIPPDFWHQADEWDEDDLPDLTNECREDAAFGDLAAALTQKKSLHEMEVGTEGLSVSESSTIDLEMSRSG